MSVDVLNLIDSPREQCINPRGGLIFWNAIMYRLFYVSSARPDMQSIDIETLVNAASMKNPGLGITGALGYDGKRFAQILEGTKEDVLALMDIIRSDNRHSGIVVMDEKPVESRVYDGWGLKQLDGLIFEHFESAMAEA